MWYHGLLIFFTVISPRTRRWNCHKNTNITEIPLLGNTPLHLVQKPSKLTWVWCLGTRIAGASLLAEMWIMETKYIYHIGIYGICCLVLHALQWRHNDLDDVSNHRPHDCLFNRLFKTQIKENIKAPRHWPLGGEFTGDRWIPRTKGQ